MPRMNTMREGRPGVDDAPNGGCVLLYDATRGTVLLIRRSRVPSDATGNGSGSGTLLEVAGTVLLEGDPESAIRREAEAVAGVRIGDLEHVLNAYLGPGSSTERMGFYAAAYDGAEGGEGTAVLELSVADALAAVRSGEIADVRTILLLQWAVLDGPFSGSAVDWNGGGGARVGAVHGQAEGEQSAGGPVPGAGELPETD
jgi:nudix-type nucleoside diphosphatase (YffH/AdpP family)